MHQIRKFFSFFASLALALSLLPLQALPVQAAGTVSLAAFGDTYTQDFNTLASTGTANTTVPEGWYFAETGTNANTTYRVGTGSSNTGDTYSFGAADDSERAFGGLRSGSLVPLVGAQFANNTGGAILSLVVSFTGEQWRLGQNTAGRAADRLDFQYSLDATSLTTGTWTDVNYLDFNSPVVSGTIGALNGNTAPNRTALSYIINELNIPNGASFWIRWADTDLIPGADDGLSVDDFALAPFATSLEPGPEVSSTLPANGAAGVALDSNITVTFNEPVNVVDPWFSLVCARSGAHEAAYLTTDGLVFTIDPALDFAKGEDCTLTIDPAAVTDQDTEDPFDTMWAEYRLTFSVVLPPLAINEVQSAGHLSPFAGKSITLLPAVVTALRTAGGTRGFYLQDLNPDADPATSEGIFVFTGSSSNPAALVAVGDLVVVSGRVSEFRAAAAGLTLTEIVAPFTVTLQSSGSTLPAPVVLGAGGLIPPSTVIEDDASGSVETTGVFDPANDGIDFYESLEGMLVQVNDAVATGPTNDFGANREIPVIGDFGAYASPRTNRGGVVIQPADFNPERIILNDWISGGPVLPPANVGDTFPGVTLGVVDYSFSNFKLQVISLPALVSGGLAQEVSAAAGLNQLSAAAFNVENLDPTDSPSKFAALAAQVVTNLSSPDILTIEEIQDSNGATNDSIVEASATWSMLIAAIQAAGGPTYDYRQIDPVDDQDGGEPGGNIRVGFLFRTDRGLTFVDRPGADSTTANAVTETGALTQLVYSPGRIDPTNPAFASSRKPLAGEFTFNGHRLFVIANHWNSKGGDEPLFGVNQPPALGSEVQRLQQAAVVHDFVSAILTADPAANVLVMGDLNDFQFSAPLATLTGSPAILTPLVDTLPLAERYSYVYEGNSQAIDHILASSALMNRPFVYDVVHVNAEFAEQVSDHDPQTLIVTLNDAPTVNAGGPYSVIEGSIITLTAAGSDLEGGPLTYAWDLDNDGTFETPGQSVPYTGANAYSVNTVKVQVTDNGGLTAVAETTVSVLFNWTGFYAPIDNPPAVNVVKAGSAVPVKFSLNGDKGLAIFANGYPLSKQIACDTGAEYDDIEETAAPGSSGLTYSPGNMRYHYAWKTNKAWSGTCRLLLVKLVDGTVHTAEFRFK